MDKTGQVVQGYFSVQQINDLLYLCSLLEIENFVHKTEKKLPIIKILRIFPGLILFLISILLTMCLMFTYVRILIKQFQWIYPK